MFEVFLVLKGVDSPKVEDQIKAINEAIQRGANFINEENQQRLKFLKDVANIAVTPAQLDNAWVGFNEAAEAARKSAMTHRIKPTFATEQGVTGENLTAVFQEADTMARAADEIRFFLLDARAVIDNWRNQLQFQRKALLAGVAALTAAGKV